MPFLSLSHLKFVFFTSLLTTLLYRFFSSFCCLRFSEELDKSDYITANAGGDGGGGGVNLLSDTNDDDTESEDNVAVNPFSTLFNVITGMFSSVKSQNGDNEPEQNNGVEATDGRQPPDEAVVEEVTKSSWWPGDESHGDEAAFPSNQGNFHLSLIFGIIHLR